MKHNYQQGERVWVRVPDRSGSRVTGRVVGRGRSYSTLIVRLDSLHPLLELEQPYSFISIERIRPTEGGVP